jgi:hypothetical protein
MTTDPSGETGAVVEGGAIADRLRRYTLVAVSASTVSAATTAALGGGLPPTSAASAAGWNYTHTLLNNQASAPGGAFRGTISWGANGTLLQTNIIPNFARNTSPVLPGRTQFRAFSVSQTPWSAGVDYVYFGAALAIGGAIIDANNTGGGLTAWNNSQLNLMQSNRSGLLANTAASWVPVANDPGLLGPSGRGIVSFKVIDHGNTYYGWIDFETQQDASKNAILTIHAWAYSTGSITAPSAVPGGAGLAALAFGAAGLHGRRRRRN